MIVEYYNYDIADSEIVLKQNLETIKDFPLDSICLLPAYTKLAKNIINPEIKIFTCIDYPMGIMDTQSRLTCLNNMVKNNVSGIEIIAPSYALCNRKYDKFREDLDAFKNICTENGIELRYTLDYRIYTYDLLYKFCKILIEYEINTIYPSSGFFLDEISDNILASAMINKKIPKINIICTGNIWNKRHQELIEKSNIYGIRVNSFNGLDLIFNP